jgi:hypothetical protein
MTRATTPAPPAAWSPDLQPVLVVCHLCRQADQPRDGHILTIPERAWWAAMDHALDDHRTALLAKPAAVKKSFTLQDGTTLRLLDPSDR